MKQAPDFSLLDQNGKIHSLKDYAGSWLVIYFYPKDDTPSCTTEACNFRDARQAIGELGKVKILGISKDTVASHKRFAEKQKLNFPILSDPDHKTIDAFGAWQLKKFMGREYMGIVRNTYIVNPDSKIAKEYIGIKPADHIKEILSDLAELKS